MSTAYHLFKLGKMIYEGKKAADEDQEEFLEKQKEVGYAVELAYYLPKYEQYAEIRDITKSPDFRTVYDFEQRDEIWKALRAMEQMIAESSFGNKEQFEKDVLFRVYYLRDVKELEWQCPGCGRMNTGDTVFYRCPNCKVPSPESIVIGNEKLMKVWVSDYMKDKRRNFFKFLKKRGLIQSPNK